MAEKVAIIGASEKPDRYANKAMHALQKHGHEVVLVNPFKKKIDGQRCLKSIGEHEGKVDTVTLYVNRKRFQDHIDDVIKMLPKRVIMNPGTENDEQQQVLEDAGITVLRGCTLVLLSTNQF